MYLYRHQRILLKAKSWVRTIRLRDLLSIFVKSGSWHNLVRWSLLCWKRLFTLVSKYRLSTLSSGGISSMLTNPFCLVNILLTNTFFSSFADTEFHLTRFTIGCDMLISCVPRSRYVWFANVLWFENHVTLEVRNERRITEHAISVNTRTFEHDWNMILCWTM